LLLTVALLIFVASIVIGVPVAFGLGLSGIIYVLLSGESMTVVPTIMFGATDSYILLSIPFFIMAGDLLARSGMLDRMVGFASATVGPTRGGLAYVNIGSSMLFGGVTGVSVADAAAIGRTLVPSMIDAGYRRGFAAAVTATSSVMGSIIPPSVGMLIVANLYGGKVSIGKLFLSGAVPGLMIGLTMMAVVFVMARLNDFPRGTDTWSLGTIVREGIGASLGLFVPVLVIGGIVGGVFTATEAGAIAVAYALVVGIGLRTLSFEDIRQSLILSVKTTGIVFILLATAKLFAWILTVNLFASTVSQIMQQYVSSPIGFLIISMSIFLVLGFVLEGMATTIMLFPVLVPLANIYGVEPHHFALLTVMTVQIALITPPVALGLFIVTPFAGCSIKDAAIESIPFVGVILLIIILVMFFPIIAMFLPNLLGYP